MERPANALTAADLQAESQKWVTISNGKSVLIGRVSVSDILRAATQIPSLAALLKEEDKAVKDKKDPVIRLSAALNQAEAAEKIVVMGVIDPRVTADRNNGSISIRDFKREDVVLLSEEILGLSGYSVKEAEEAKGFSGTPG